MRASRLAICALLLAGCAVKRVDPSQYSTPAREFAKARVIHYASVAGIRTPPVKFWLPPDGKSAAWCPCDRAEVWINAYWLTYATEPQVDHAAAHELAHLFLRPPCPGSEDAAEACAKRLEQGLACVRG